MQFNEPSGMRIHTNQLPHRTLSTTTNLLSESYRFVFTKLREENPNIQLQEVRLYSANATMPLTVVSVTNPGGSSPGVQPPEDAFDGDLTTKGSKWLDTNFQTVGSSTLILSLSEPQIVAAYGLMTADDQSKRDPVSWEFSRLHEGEWIVMDAQTDFPAPIERYTWYTADQLSLGFPLYSPPPSVPLSPSQPSPSPPPAPPILPPSPPVALSPPSPPSGSVFQFVFTSVRDSSAAIASLSEILLFDADGEQVAVSEATNPLGDYAASESPLYVIDGSTQTKWLDHGFQGETILRLYLAQPVHVAEYELITTSGSTAWYNLKRDPTSWIFGVWREGGDGEEGEGETLQVLSTVTGLLPPTSRSTSYGRFYSIMPPPPLAPPLPLCVQV